MEVKYHFFWKRSPFSNWWIQSFTWRGTQFNCAEQALMWAKADLFADEDSKARILNTPDPKEQKRLGRNVARFDQFIWDFNKEAIMEAILFEKFNQNPDLLKKLLNQGDVFFVEASPFDRIWGIGYDQENALANMWNWGENLLGKALTNVAKKLDNPPSKA